jgi:hypothetical protein
MQRDKIQACLVQVDWLRKCLSKASTLSEKNRDINQAYKEVIEYLNEPGQIFEHTMYYPYGDYSVIEANLRSWEETIVSRTSIQTKMKILGDLHKGLLLHVKYYAIGRNIKEEDSFEMYI